MAVWSGERRKGKTMSERKYFNEALSNFTYESASGGEIRHLADLGYGVKQIVECLDFPTPYERVQKTVWEHLHDTGVLLSEEPGSGKQKEKSVYVKEYDKYGKPSFRRINETNKEKRVICWEKYHFDKSADGNLADFLFEKCKRNGEHSSYVSCDFGLLAHSRPGQYKEMLQFLTEQQREYILGLPWERKIVYHILNKQMREIVAGLYKSSVYHAGCYFMDIEELVAL